MCIFSPAGKALVGRASTSPKLSASRDTNWMRGMASGAVAWMAAAGGAAVAT